MEHGHEKLKERAYSVTSYMDSKGKRPVELSPEFRPSETGVIPPLMSLSPSILENKKLIKDLIEEKQQDQHLISLLKKHSFEQSKEIEKLKNKLEHLQKDYENLLEKSTPSRDHQSIITTAILARSRSESINNP